MAFVGYNDIAIVLTYLAPEADRPFKHSVSFCWLLGTNHTHFRNKPSARSPLKKPFPIFAAASCEPQSKPG